MTKLCREDASRISGVPVGRATETSQARHTRSVLGVAIPLAFIFLFPFGFMWQGLELTDTGYTLANMQQFFHSYPTELNDPGIGSCWLTYVIGGIWYHLTGGCGLIGFRVLYLVILFCVVGLVWLLLRDMGGGNKTWLAIFAGVAMVVARSAYLPSYNEFTALFFVLSASALCYGLVSGRQFFVFLAGTIGGASIFIRLPNLAFGGIVVAILFFRADECFNGVRSWRAAVQLALRECVVFTLGYLSGLGTVLALMGAMGQVSAYLQMLRQMSTMLGDPTQHHAGGRLLRGLLHDYFYSGIAGVAFLAIGSLVAWFAATTHNQMLRIVWMLGLTLTLTLAAMKSDDLAAYLWPGVIYSILFLGAVGMLKLGRKHRLICVLAGAVLFFTPLGSNNGISNAAYAMCVAAPVAILALITRRPLLDPQPDSDGATSGISERLAAASPANTSHGSASNAWLEVLKRRAMGIRLLNGSVIGYAVLCAMVGSAVAYRWDSTYRDSARRLTLRATVDHPKLRCVFTNTSRARCLNELLMALQPLVRKDEYLLDHMQIPMLYFLTETRPYLYSTWANLFQPPVFEQMLRRAEADRRVLPVCVRTKIDTCNPEWPNGISPPVKSYRFDGNRHLFEAFLESHNYHKHWQNDAFEIWLPPSSRNNG